jgi:hypothetical protein
MNTTNFSFTVIAKLDLSHTNGDKTSKHEGLSFLLEPSENLFAPQYIDKEGLPTKEGSEVIMKVLVSALAANIHTSHQSVFKDKEEHLKEVIKRLEEQVALEAIAKKSMM